MRQVAWSNLWNWTHSGGHGSRVHLTESEGMSGMTLCGKAFPRAKGHPIMVRCCKRCLQKAGVTAADLRNVPYVPSSED